MTDTPTPQDAHQNNGGEERKGVAPNITSPPPVNPEVFSQGYTEPNAAQIPWPNVPWDPADQRGTGDVEREGRAEELTGKKPTVDRWGKPFEQGEVPRGEPQDVPQGPEWNPPTPEETAEARKRGEFLGSDGHPTGSPSARAQNRQENREEDRQEYQQENRQ